VDLCFRQSWTKLGYNDPSSLEICKRSMYHSVAKVLVWRERLWCFGCTADTFNSRFIRGGSKKLCKDNYDRNKCKNRKRSVYRWVHRHENEWRITPFSSSLLIPSLNHAWLLITSWLNQRRGWRVWRKETNVPKLCRVLYLLSLDY
jgi:hypothetical protein